MFVWIDGLAQRSREGGRVVNVVAAIATGVNADGHREILGLDVFTAEDGASWTNFLRGLVARGLSGVRLVVSEYHPGLKRAITAVLPGASWQRCGVHLLRNLLARVLRGPHEADFVGFSPIGPGHGRRPGTAEQGNPTPHRHGRHLP